MRSSTWRLEDLRNVILNLGFVGENLHTRQIFDCKKMFDQYPQASVSMTVTPPEGEPYPGSIERDGDLVIWDVRDSDLVAEGDGEIQIVFTQEPHIARSYNARTHVCRSQVPTGDVPSGLDDFVTRADQLLEQVEDTFPAGGTTGQVLAKKSDADYDTEWVDQGAGGTSDYDELENRPQIGGVTLTGNKTLHDLGAASEADVAAKYTKPETGIPASDMAAGVIPDPEDLIDDEAGSGDTDKVWSADKSHELLTEINSRYTKPNTGIPATDMASSVQTSLNNADSAYQKPPTGIPASDMAEGVIPDITGKADKTVTDDLQKNKAPVIIDSATGNPIVLSDGADGLPVESMKIHFLPKQDTSGGDPSPSHVCPISGWTGLTAWRTGKNLLPLPVAETKYGITLTHNADGSITLDGTSTNLVYFDFFSGDFDSHNLAGYRFVAVGYSAITNVSFRISESDRVALQSSTNGSLIINDNGNGLYFAIRIASGTAMPTGGLTIYPMLIESEADSTFKPYTGQSYPVQFADTYYGGTLDPVTGVLVVDKKYALLNDPDKWEDSSGNVNFVYQVEFADRKLFNTSYEGLICSAFKVSTQNVQVYMRWQNESLPKVGVRNVSETVVTLADLKNLSESGQLSIVYDLATPIEIQLDPLSVQTLLGDNTIWSDANGQIELDYRADTKLWISGHSTTVDSSLSDTSENPVQNKVVKTALDAKEPKHDTTTVSGATPTITGVENTRYICGECSTLTITAPASGCIDVIFESGSTPTVLTVTSAKTGVSAIKWANGFDPSSLEANTTYEINILDGEFGVVGSWT